MNGSVVTDVSIIICNYNAGELLGACIRSIVAHVKCGYEIIVVDNGSTDGSLASLPEHVRVIHSGCNAGFAKASNIGARRAQGKILHFLNPDAEVRQDINEAYKTALADSDVLYATNVVDTHRNWKSRGHALPTLKNIFNLLFRRSQIEKWYIGASIIASPQIFLRLGGWSEDYFMYGDDIDLFYKAKLNKIESRLLPAKVFHCQGGSSRQIWSDDERMERVERSTLIFAKKFGLQFDYFVFKHLAVTRRVLRQPASAGKELKVYWRQLIFGSLPEASVVPILKEKHNV